LRLSPTHRRAGLAALATSLVIGGTFAGAGTAHAKADFDLERLAGDNRYATSAKAAEEFGQANTVILASGEPGRYPDALAANYLAGLEKAPVLLTRKDTTPEVVRQAIKDSGARNIVIVGGESAVSSAQQEELAKEYSVKRLSGDDRYGTAAAIIDNGGKAGDTALLATGTNFPDALGGGPVAYAEDMPLAITKPGDMPNDVLASLKSAGVSKVLVLGGESAVGQAVVDELKKEGIEVTKRFAGADRAETSALLARHAIANFGFDDTAVNVASGFVQGDGADALGGAAVTGKAQRALLITKSESTAGNAILAFLNDFSDSLTQGLIFGGTSALTQDLELTLEKAVLGSGAQIGNELFDTPAEAVAAAKEGDTITVFGTDNEGFTVDKKGVTVKGENGAGVTSAIQVKGVDGVTISDLVIKPSNVGGEVAGVYLDDAEGVTISGNSFEGTAQEGSGVINTAGGADEVATITNNTFVTLLRGTFANPSAQYTIDDNVFRDNKVGTANDAPSVITDNRFIDNELEGIGMSVAGSEVTGNSFKPHDVYVADYTSDKSYDLKKIITDNTFDNEVEVSADDTKIVDKTEASSSPSPSPSSTN
jgi:putative cell wall-binding protein